MITVTSKSIPKRYLCNRESAEKLHLDGPSIGDGLGSYEVTITVRTIGADGSFREVAVRPNEAIAVQPGDHVELLGVDPDAATLDQVGDDIVVRLEGGEEYWLRNLARYLEGESGTVLVFGSEPNHIIASLDALLAEMSPAAGIVTLTGGGGTFRADGDLDIDGLGGARVGARGPGDGIGPSAVDPFGLDSSFGSEPVGGLGDGDDDTAPPPSSAATDSAAPAGLALSARAGSGSGAGGESDGSGIDIDTSGSDGDGANLPGGAVTSGATTPTSGDDSPPPGDNTPPLGDDSPPLGDNSPPPGDDSPPPPSDDSPPPGDNSPPPGDNSPPPGDGGSGGSGGTTPATDDDGSGSSGTTGTGPGPVSVAELQVSTSNNEARVDQLLKVTITETGGGQGSVQATGALADETAKQVIELNFAGGELTMDPSLGYTVTIEHTSGSNTLDITGLNRLDDSGNLIVEVNPFAGSNDDFDVTLGLNGGNYDGGIYILDPAVGGGWDVAPALGYELEDGVLSLDTAFGNKDPFDIDLGDLNVEAFAAVDTIDISGNTSGNSDQEHNTLSLSVAEVLDFTDDNGPLTILGDAPRGNAAGDTVVLGDQDGAGGKAWSLVEGDGFDVWTYGSGVTPLATVIVEDGVNVLQDGIV